MVRRVATAPTTGSQAPHLLRAAQLLPARHREREKRDPTVMLYTRTDTPRNGTILLRRITVSKQAEVITAFCTACRRGSLGTSQVLCYQRTLSHGRRSGVGVEEAHESETGGSGSMRLAAQAKGGFYPTPERVVDLSSWTWWRAPTGSPPQKHAQTLRILDPCCGAGEAVARAGTAHRAPGQAAAWRPTGWSCTGNGLRRRKRCCTAAWPRTSSAPPSPTAPSGCSILNPPYDYDQEERRVEHSFLTHCTRYLAEEGRTGVHRATAQAARLGPLPSLPLREAQVLVLSPSRSGGPIDQVVLIGHRKVEPSFDAQRRGAWCGQWGRGGGAGTVSMQRYPLYHRARGMPAGGCAVRHPYRGPGGGCH